MLVLCGVFVFIVLTCKKKRPIRNVQQRGQPKIDSNLSGSVTQKTARFSHHEFEQLYTEIEAVHNSNTDNHVAHDGEENDDEIYDDIINIAGLTKVKLNKKRDYTIESDESIKDLVPDNIHCNYDDAIICGKPNQPPLESLTTYNTNPAYTTCQEYLTISVEPVTELMTNDSQSDLDDYENADEGNLNEGLIDNDAYIKNFDYLQVLLSISTFSKCSANGASSQTKTDCHQQPVTMKLKQRGTLHDYECPDVASKLQDLTNCGAVAVVHDYDYTTTNMVEHLRHVSPLVSPLVSHEGQSTISQTQGTNLVSGTLSKGEKGKTKSPYTDTSSLDHVYDYADSSLKKRRDQIAVKVEQMDDGDIYTTTIKNVEDVDQSPDDHDYNFDRLSPCTYLDPEQLHNNRSGPDKVHGSVGDVTYSQISPVTHWEGKWSDEDRMRANAVYAKVNAMSKKVKPGTLNKKLGTLV